MDRWIEPLTVKDPAFSVPARQSAISGLMVALEQMAGAGVFDGMPVPEQKMLAVESMQALAEDDSFWCGFREMSTVPGSDSAMYVATKAAVAFTRQASQRFPNHPFFDQFNP